MPLREGKGLKEIVKSFDEVKRHAYTATRLSGYTPLMSRCCRW